MRATGPLAPLHIGDIVSVQNQTGVHPKCWIKLESSLRPSHTVSTLYSSMDLVAWLCATASFCTPDTASVSCGHLSPPPPPPPTCCPHTTTPLLPMPCLLNPLTLALGYQITSHQHHLLPRREASLHLLCPVRHPCHPPHHPIPSIEASPHLMWPVQHHHHPRQCNVPGWVLVLFICITAMYKWST